MFYMKTVYCASVSSHLLIEEWQENISLHKETEMLMMESLSNLYTFP